MGANSEKFLGEDSNTLAWQGTELCFKIRSSHPLCQMECERLLEFTEVVSFSSVFLSWSS
jgi:hypothetical protein